MIIKRFHFSKSAIAVSLRSRVLNVETCDIFLGLLGYIPEKNVKKSMSDSGLQYRKDNLVNDPAKV